MTDSSKTVSTLEPDRYAIEAKLGEGGMGEVFQITDSKFERQVAIKTLRPDLAQDSVALSRFLQEAKVTGRLEHPAIPPVHDMGIDGSGQHYFTMKLVRGKTLDEVIRGLRSHDHELHAKFSFSYRAQIIISICQAVQFANSNGVFHRDIKPENVMIGEHGEVQLMDWGIAFDAKQKVNIVREPDFIGTVSYASPERFSSRETAWTPQSEVYSIAALMYEFFTLQLPFAGHTVVELMNTIITKEAVAPFQVRSAFQTPCPIEYSYVISKAMNKDPNLRTACAEVLARQIQLALQDEAPVVCPCTAVKYQLHIFDKTVDNLGGIGAFVILMWILSPFFLLPAFLYLSLVPH